MATRLRFCCGLPMDVETVPSTVARINALAGEANIQFEMADATIPTR
jgi:hypothetical protein